MDTQPDFESETWEGTRIAIIAGGKTVEEVVQILQQSWRVQHNKNLEAWTLHLQQL